jgi:hypothetical protein
VAEGRERTNPVTADFGFGQDRPPVRWMLEAAIVVELALGTYVEAGIIALCSGSAPRWDSSKKVAELHRP